MSNYRNILEAYLKTLDVKADRVLDVGGAAKPVKDRVRSWDVKEYKIADSGLEEGVKDFELDLNKTQLRGTNNYDIIFCLEVMEYINDPAHSLDIIWSYVSEGGFLYITFPFIYPAHEPVGNDYLRYTAQGAARLLGEAGFKILEITNRAMRPESFEAYKQFMKLEGFHASKHCRHDLLGWIIKAQKI